MTRYYAGIGSRESPPEVLSKMTQIASWLLQYDYTLRSGGASGADLAFEAGAGNNKEIYLPWAGYHGRHKGIAMPENAWAWEHVRKHHPVQHILTVAARKLMARNTYQVLGPSEAGPRSDFIICWTKDGEASGGTRQAIRIANHYRIPVFNLKTDGEDRLQKFIGGGPCE